MDMSFLLKSMLPPGVTVEALQSEGLAILQKVLSAVKMMEDTHRLMLEQNAMLRLVIEQSQAPDPFNQQKASNVDQTHDVTVQVPEPDGQPIGQQQPLCEPGERTNSYPGDGDIFGSRDPGIDDSNGGSGNAAIRNDNAGY